MYSGVYTRLHSLGVVLRSIVIRAVNSHHSRRYHLTIHNLALCVTKCREFLLLGDKPLSTTKPRLYITTLELLCKSYAVGAVVGFRLLCGFCLTPYGGWFEIGVHYFSSHVGYHTVLLCVVWSVVFVSTGILYFGWSQGRGEIPYIIVF